MAVRQTILRYIHILNKLRKAPASFIEIDEYLSMQSNLHDEKFNVSKRQFQRDKKDMESIFELEIIHDRHRDVYFINEQEQSEISQRRLEAFDTFNALKLGNETASSIHFEKRRPQGTENLFGLLHAIKNKLKIKFTYQKFWKEEATIRVVAPYALKEFKNRWYVLAKDQNDGNIKTFALDRLTGLVITSIRFQRPADFNVEKSYKHCFGIISPNGQKPEEVILSFNAHQGKYVKSLPLHSSQQILVDNEKEVRIQLKLFLTYDFLSEILSHGAEVQVISPQKLVEQMTDTYKNALKQYPNDETN